MEKSLSDEEYEDMLRTIFFDADRAGLERHMKSKQELMLQMDIDPSVATQELWHELSILTQIHHGTANFSLKVPPDFESFKKWMIDTFGVPPMSTLPAAIPRVESAESQREAIALNGENNPSRTRSEDETSTSSLTEKHDPSAAPSESSDPLEQNKDKIIEVQNAMILRLRGRLRFKGIPDKEMLRKLVDTCRKKNGKINFHKLSTELGKTDKTAKAWCVYHKIE